MDQRIYEEHKKKLLEKIEDYAKEDVILAFSGGVDSGLILAIATKAAERTGHTVYAVTIKTTLHPMGEAKEAERMAKEMGAVHKLLEVDEFQCAGIGDNPKDRCYRCKKYIFTELKHMAENMGIATILDGTNEDDLHVYRPGIRALKELSVKSPLAETGMTKEEIREFAKELFLPIAQKPSAPCLATRFPYGTRLSGKEMDKVEKGEQFLRSLGFYNVRIRVYGDMVRIEVDEKDLGKIMEHRDKILSCLMDLGYLHITLDLAGFHSGSMDLQITEK